jgi:hypothetical protein
MPFRPDLSQYEKHPRTSVEENLTGISREFDSLGREIAALKKSPSTTTTLAPSVTSHPLLTERDSEDQHPISAIAGLQDTLDAEASARASADSAEISARVAGDNYVLSQIVASSANWDGGHANSNYGGTTSINGGNA